VNDLGEVGSGSDGTVVGKGLLDDVLMASPDAIIVIDEGGSVLFASPATSQLFGYEPCELVGQTIEQLVPGDLRDAHLAHRKAYASDPTPRPMGIGLELTGRRRDGTTFPVDVSLTPIRDGARRLVGAFVRDASDRRQNETRLAAINEITQYLLAGEGVEATLGLIASWARRLVDASLGWVVTPTSPDQLIISAADGPGAERALGTIISTAVSISGRALETNAPVLVDDLSSEPHAPDEMLVLDLGPALFVPLGGDERGLGVLVVGRRRGSEDFTPSNVALIQVFASAAEVALALGEARADVEQLQVAAEHDRIARDLHDTVIQRLFGLGMGLQSVQRLATGPVAERIERVVDGLDEVIHEIRETIFDLQQPAVARSGLRMAVREVTSAAAEQLGFRPRLGFVGPVDAAASDGLKVHVTAVLTEALSNVARHARASTVQVVVAVEASDLVVSVADDGIGPPEGRTAGSGLGNLAERAEAFGGTVTLTGRKLGGSLLEWRVPMG
jgi:PAS domain S-box-containing protein